MGPERGWQIQRKLQNKSCWNLFATKTYLGHPKTWKISFQETVIDIVQGSLNYQFWGDETMQIYGKFEGFPFYNALFGLVI